MDGSIKMKDIDLAKATLNDKNLSLVIVKDGQIIYESDGRGIYPLYMAVKKCGDDMKDASAADKVIGRGAARLYKFSGIKSIFAYLISEGTKEVLIESNIAFETEKTVPFIKNREGTGMCPVETLSYESETFDDLMKRIEAFLKQIKLV
jgi:hypothetical protein